jgi:lipoprotein-anchoring transpeptidase ErfK/SrfK
MTTKIPTNNYANHFDPSKAHHLAFLQGLLDRVDELDPAALQPGGDLRDIWVAAVPSKTPLVSLTPPQGPSGWAEITSMAKTAGAKFPELVAAQWALESGWGKHTSGRNNYFGLKGAGTKTTTKEFVNGKWIEITDSFIDFATPQDSVKYLVEKWYKDFKNYKGVNNAASREAAARMLVSEGYATDPDYAAKLIRLMNDNFPAPSTPSVVALPLQQVILQSPRPLVIPGAVGPKKTPHDFGFKAGDTHIIVNDITETAQAFDFTGKRLWQTKALARGQGAETEWRYRNTDTPPGVYRVGDIYKDYEKVGANPKFDRTLMSYGWYSLDLIDLEGQESRYGRAGIMIHGGGSACGWPGAWAPMQKLFPTHGCIRMHNVDLRDKLLPLTKFGKIFVSVYQESP